MLFLTIFLLNFSDRSTALHQSSFSVYQIVPKRTAELQAIADLYETSEDGIDFWRPPSSLNTSVDVMLHPHSKTKFLQLLRKIGIPYKVVIEDLEKVLRSKEATQRNVMRDLFFRKERVNDDRSQWSGIQMGEYHSYTEIVNWLKAIEIRYSSIARVVSIGTSREGRVIYGIKIGAKFDNSSRAVWIDGGIHAREWASVHTTLYFIEQLVLGYGSDHTISGYVEKLDIYIFPCLNPDGYEFTRSDPHNPAVRMWRKNMSPEKCMGKKDGTKRCCKGVDLNRNFAFRFAEVGSSFLPCSEIYHGDGAFSEPETRSVRDAVLSMSGRLDAFITLHTYSQLWIYPFSHKKYSYSADVNDLKAVAREAVASLERLYGTQYRYGTGPEIIYPFAGGSTDWAKATAGVKYSYTIELRPSYFNWNGFVLDKKQLIPTGRETFEGVKVVFDKVIEEDNKRRGITETCFDTSPSCAHWIRQDPSICQRSPLAMKKECRRSCSFCS